MKMARPIVALVIAMAGIPAMAQSQNSGSATDTSKPAATEKAPASTTPAKKPETAQKPKKVWTDDDMGSLKSSVSVVGTRNQPQNQMESADDPSDGKTDPHAQLVRRYRDSIDSLRTQIGEAEARIAQLKNFKAENGSPSGGINPNHGYNMLPPEEQVKQLEARKRQLQDKIEDLENQARKEGIDPGELR